jgi:hypothetical protein
VVEKNNINLMRLAPRCSAQAKRTGCRCRAPAVKGWNVCRVHGARGGAPEGKANGNYRHGGRTKRTMASRAAVAALARLCRQTMDEL